MCHPHIRPRLSTHSPWDRAQNRVFPALHCSLLPGEPVWSLLSPEDRSQQGSEGEPTRAGPGRLPQAPPRFLLRRLEEWSHFSGPVLSWPSNLTAAPSSECICTTPSLSNAKEVQGDDQGCDQQIPYRPRSWQTLARSQPQTRK